MSRFTSLLRSLGLEQRLVDENGLSKIDVNVPIDWDKVNLILYKKIKVSKTLLLNELK